MRDNRQTKCTSCARRCERQDGKARRGEECALRVMGHLGKDATSCRRPGKCKARGARAGCIRGAAWRPPPLKQREGDRGAIGEMRGPDPWGRRERLLDLEILFFVRREDTRGVWSKGVTSLKGSARPLCGGWLRTALWGQGDQPGTDGDWERAVGGWRSSWILDSC